MSITDGDALPEGLKKERKRSPRLVILAVILAAVLVLGTIAWLTVQIANNGKSHPIEYTTHSAISIDGNGEFTNASGVVWGSGTASDPYIIADWEITEINPSGILIQKTDAHFIVRNCYVHGSSHYYDGIFLWLCVNGTLEGNNCSDCYYGITVDSSSNNTLINNNCSSNYVEGVSLFSSSYITLRNNNCSNNHNGIKLNSSSNNNTLISNTCSSNLWHGIDIESSSNNNEISWNQVSNNGGCGVSISSGSNNRIWNNVIINNNGATDTYRASNAQARDDGTNNCWNITDIFGDHGNYWSDWTTPDGPYIILGSAGAKDYYPLSYDPRYFGISFIPSCLS